jgi:hypothetical protein
MNYIANRETASRMSRRKRLYATFQSTVSLTEASTWRATLKSGMMLHQFELYSFGKGCTGYDKERTPLQPEPSIAFITLRRQRARGTIIVAHGAVSSPAPAAIGVNVADYFVKAVLTQLFLPTG